MNAVSPFDAAAPSILPHGDAPPAFFFPGPVHPIPPGEGGRGRHGNNTMALRSYPLAQAVGSGWAQPPQGKLCPLSLTNNAPVAIREMGQMCGNARFQPMFSQHFGKNNHIIRFGRNFAKQLLQGDTPLGNSWSKSEFLNCQRKFRLTSSFQRFLVIGHQ